MWKNIDTCLLDIGNVMLNIDYFAMDLFWEDIPADSDFKRDFVKLIMDYEHGWMSTNEFIARAQTEFQAPKTNEFLTTWLNMFSADRILWEQVLEWKSLGKRLILFSNINELHHQGLRQFPIFKEIPEGIFSYLIGSVKPEPEIYQYAINTLGVDPARCLYLDDLAPNLEAGKKHGFLAHSFHALTAAQDLERIKKALH